MCKTRGGHTSERDKIGKKQWTSGTKNRKKGRNIDTYNSQVCEGPSFDRVWQFPTDSQQTIMTDVSRGTGMCLNIIFNLVYIACVKYMFFIVEFKTSTAASGAIAVGTKAPWFSTTY